MAYGTEFKEWTVNDQTVSVLTAIPSAKSVRATRAGFCTEVFALRYSQCPGQALHTCFLNGCVRMGVSVHVLTERPVPPGQGMPKVPRVPATLQLRLKPMPVYHLPAGSWVPWPSAAQLVGRQVQQPSVATWWGRSPFSSSSSSSLGLAAASLSPWWATGSVGPSFNATGPGGVDSPSNLTLDVWCLPRPM